MGTRSWVVRAVWLLWLASAIAAIYQMRQYGALRLTPAQAYELLSLSVLVLLTTFSSLLTAAPSRPRVVPAVSGVIAGGTILSLGLALGWHFIGTGTPAPPAFISDVTDPSQFDSVLAYSRRIEYDSRTHGTADSAFLTDTAGGVRPGIKAWIAPAGGANFVSYRSLAGTGRGRGRVVARISVDTSGGLGYPLLNLPAGVSYIWVDSLRISDTTGTFRAFIIPDRAGGKVSRFPGPATFVYLRSPGTFANFPMARWVLHHSFCFNTGCSNGCCRVCPS
jgi:hypothetical protein